MTPVVLPTDVPAAFQSAWNAHDMNTFAALFHERATFVNRFGHYVRGVDEIVTLTDPRTGAAVLRRQCVPRPTQPEDECPV